VSIGFRDRRRTQVHAVSHSVKFSKKANLIRNIEMAMDEALDQQCTVAYPPLEKDSLTLTCAHEALSTRHGNAALCTIPLGNNGRLYGAIGLERRDATGFDAGEVERAEVIASLLGPILEIKRKESRWLGAKLADSVDGLLRKLLGPRHIGMKLATASVVVLVAFLMLANGQYRVSADAVLEGTIQRVVVAPMDGYIAAAEVRAGDLVHEGEVLGTLDDKDLTLELVRWQGQHKQLAREHRKALAVRDRSQTRILSAQITQAAAQIQLLEEQLSRTRFVSPFDGVVVSGDLSQKLGSPVERGQVLFEVAPLDSYRVMLDVDEQQIAEVSVGQRGHLALTGFPGERMPIHIEMITPVSTAEKGKNFFRVEAGLDASPVSLRPGMQGVGKIELGERKLMWIWTYKLLNWLRVWAWSWWP
jgi:multidrug resistance efflux pump